MDTTEPWLRSSEVAEITGLSLRQIQWLCERKLVDPYIDSHARLFDDTEVMRVCMIAEMRRKGLSLNGIRKVLSQVDSVAGRYVAIAVYPGSTKARTMLGGDSAEDLVRIADKWDCPVVVIDREKFVKKGAA